MNPKLLKHMSRLRKILGLVIGINCFVPFLIMHTRSQSKHMLQEAIVSIINNNSRAYSQSQFINWSQENHNQARGKVANQKLVTEANINVDGKDSNNQSRKAMKTIEANMADSKKNATQLDGSDEREKGLTMNKPNHLKEEIVNLINSNATTNKVKQKQLGCSNNYTKVIETTIFAAVFSAPGNVKDRTRLRELFADKSQDFDISYAFFIGESADATVRLQLQKETTLHNDIIQGNFTDSYRTLYMKSLFMLKWLTELCEKPPRVVIKLDDDLRINMSFFRKTLTNITVPEDTGIILGDVEYAGKPQRKSYNRNYLSRDEYQEDTFPPFTFGPAYMLCGNALQKLYNASLHVPHLWLEDVYITGLLRQYAGIPIKNASSGGRLVCTYKLLGKGKCVFGHEGRNFEALEKLRKEESDLKRERLLKEKG